MKKRKVQIKMKELIVLLAIFADCLSLPLNTKDVWSQFKVSFYVIFSLSNDILIRLIIFELKTDSTQEMLQRN